MTADVETIVVGAGVVGLAIANALAQRGAQVMVIERNASIGAETSARNSEVVHAGLYYPPGSLRARLCVEGKARLYRFAADNGVACQRLGKLLVASEVSEVGHLEAIAATAAANGVGDLVRLSPAAVRDLEPEVACVAAILSPSTGIVDSHGLMAALEGHITTRGGEVVLATNVERIARRPDGAFALTVASGGAHATVSAARLVLAAGLGGSALGRTLHYPDGYQVPATYPAKGHYFMLRGRSPFRHLVYPMPSGAWLGVHLTLDIEGQAKFGPDIDWVEAIDYAFEDDDGARRADFERAIRRWWPGLPANALTPGYTGIRPKLYRPGEPVADFAIHGPKQHGVARLVQLYGIESPGLTASLAIGEHVAGLLET